MTLIKFCHPTILFFMGYSSGGTSVPIISKVDKKNGVDILSHYIMSSCSMPRHTICYSSEGETPEQTHQIFQHLHLNTTGKGMDCLLWNHISNWIQTRLGFKVFCWLTVFKPVDVMSTKQFWTAPLCYKNPSNTVWSFATMSKVFGNNLS